MWPFACWRDPHRHSDRQVTAERRIGQTVPPDRHNPYHPDASWKISALVERCTLQAHDLKPLPIVIVPHLRKCLNQGDELRELGVSIEPCEGSRSTPAAYEMVGDRK